MERFKRILVAIEASGTKPACLVRAAELAKDTGATLVIAVVVPKIDFPNKLMKLLGRETPRELSDEHYQEVLVNACSSAGLDEMGVSYETKLLRGRPFRQLIHEVERSNIDILMVDASEPSKSNFFGPLENRLMRNCPCPVWVLKPKLDGSSENILAAIDPQPQSPEEETLNQRIIDLATSLAEWEKAKLHVVAAWHVRGDVLLRSRMQQDAFNSHVREVCAEAKNYFGRVVKSSPLVGRNGVLELGDPAEVILESVEKVTPDVVVMGTLARSGVPGMVMGNTAETVLASVSTSVLTLKPANFVSPVVVNNE